MTDNSSKVIYIADYLMPQVEDNFSLKIDGTVYEVSTHFNPKGTQSVMEQFRQLILSEKLI